MAVGYAFSHDCIDYNKGNENNYDKFKHWTNRIERQPS